MTRKRALVVAYYFPPMGLSGVQRISKLVKYLPEHGWDVTVISVKPRGYFAYDDSLSEEVDASGATIERTASFDPTRLFPGKRTVAAPSRRSRRGFGYLTQLLFVPDNKIGWYRFAVHRGRAIASKSKPDIILSSAPPYTAHRVGARLAKDLGVPLVADFRDDWLLNPLHRYPTSAHRALHARMEKSILSAADVVTTINERILESLSGRCPDSSTRFEIVPQGFDPEDFARPPVAERGERFTMLYAGVFYGERKPDTFLMGLAGFLDQRPAARSLVASRFAGLVPNGFGGLVARLGLEDVVHHEGYLRHDLIPQALQEATVLWLTVGANPGAAGISTGKLFEYIGSRRPVLGIVPEGAAADAIRSYGAGFVCGPNVEDVTRMIGKLFDLWQRDALPMPDESFVSRFDRRKIAATVARILDETAGR